MDIKTRTVIESTVTRTLELDGETIRLMLGSAGVVIPNNAEVSIHFSVPGGGDWSHSDIEVTETNPITVKWTVGTHSTKDS